tara:strand:- start:434 stop:1954 length:1521 start_codon:yes stop_codon:yes gene_type:complete
MSQKKTIIIDVDAKDGIKQVDNLKKGVEGVDTSSKGAKTGLGGMTGMTKKLGVAFKALGIGLIVAAFMKLKDIFSGNIETARAFERVTSQLSAAFDVIRDRAEDFIKSLIKLKNPLKAFKEAFTGTTAEIKEETKAMGDLTTQLQKVRDEERDMLLIRAKANKIIAESRLLAEDDTKSMEERLAALKAAVAEEKRVADMEVATQKKKVDTLQAVIDLGKSSEEDIAELAAERARLIELQTASVLKQKRVAAEIGTFTNQIAKKEEKIETDRLARIELNNAAKELGLQITEEMTNKEVDALIKKKEKELEVEQKAAEKLKIFNEKEAEKLKKQKEKEAAADLKIQKAKIAARKAAEIQGAKMLLGTLGKLAGEGTAAAKATAVAQILINSAQGVSAAIKAGAGIPFPGNLAAIATGVSTVLGGIASAKAVLSKVEGPDEGIDDDVSDVNVDSTSIAQSGLTGQIPQFEGIFGTGGQTGQQPVQAFVVENDISNAQALQSELEIQATL